MPATLSVWQPEQRSIEQLGGGVLLVSSWTEIPSSPQAATPPAVAASEAAISSARRALVIGCDSIGDRCPPAPAPSLVLVLCALALAALRRRRARPSASARHAFTVTLDDYLIRPQKHPRARAASADGDGHQPRPAGPHVPDPQQDDRNVLAFTTIRARRVQDRARSSSAAGTYTMYCVLANHEELGMHGTLTVG